MGFLDTLKSPGKSLTRLVSEITVEPTLFFYYLSVYLLFGGFQNMIFTKVCIGHFNETFCGSGNLTSHLEEFNLVQQTSSMWIKYCTMAMVIPSIVTDCFLGAWSDIFGRKVTLLMPPIGGFLSAIVYACQAGIPELGVEWALLASALMGSFGSYTSIQTGVVAYIGSITSKGNDRTLRIGVVESMTFISGTFGPFVSGQIVSHCGSLALFILIACIHLCGLMYTTFCLENINPTKFKFSASDNWFTTLRKVFPLTHILDCIRTCLKSRPNRNRSRIICYLLMAVILMIVTAGEMDIAFLFVREPPLGWEIQTFSYWFGTRFGISSFSLLLILPLMQALGAGDTFVCSIGILSKISSLLLFAWSTDKPMGFSVLLVGCLGSLSLSSLRAMISKCVEDDEQGKLFGVFAVLEDISALLGAAIFNTVFPIIRATFSGGLFVASAIALAPLLLGLPMLEFTLSVKTNQATTKL